jgi:hypothetical protein
MIKPENCPVITILMKDLTSAIEIKKILKGYGRIAYEVFSLSETLKYGESADEKDGERVYRQVWQFPGWNTVPSDNAAGCDILDVVRQRPNLTKNDIAVRVWDLNKIPCQNTYDPHKETRDVEQELIRRHIEQYKRAPIGNKIEQKRYLRGQPAVKFKSTVIGSVTEKLFEEVN